MMNFCYGFKPLKITQTWLNKISFERERHSWRYSRHYWRPSAAWRQIPQICNTPHNVCLKSRYFEAKLPKIFIPAKMMIFRFDLKWLKITQKRSNKLRKSVEDTLRVASCVSEPHADPKHIPCKPATFVAKLDKNRPNAMKILSFSSTFATNVAGSHGMSPVVMWVSWTFKTTQKLSLALWTTLFGQIWVILTHFKWNEKFEIFDENVPGWGHFAGFTQNHPKISIFWKNYENSNFLKNRSIRAIFMKSKYDGREVQFSRFRGWEHT